MDRQDNFAEKSEVVLQRKDLGCGSNDIYRETGMLLKPDNQFEPWLCRILHAIGARPIGIDIGPLSGERFEYYERNLNSPNSLEGIPDNSVDLANAKQLFDSPFLIYRLGINPQELRQNLLP